MNSDRYIIVKATEGIEVHTHERRVIVVVGGCRVNGIVTSLDDLTPPANATETAPDDTDTLAIHKGVAGWFNFTWAKLREWLGTTFQATLVSGTNIKTINSESVLGEGNIDTPDTIYTHPATHPQSIIDQSATEADTPIDASRFHFWDTVNNLWRAITLETLKTIFSPFRIAAPTTSYEDVAAEDTLQDIAGKVLGLQESLIDLTTDSLASVIEITHDKHGNPLSIPSGRSLMLFVYAPEHKDSLGEAINGRVNLQINGRNGSHDYYSLMDDRNRIIPHGTSIPDHTVQFTIHNRGTVFVFSQSATDSVSNINQMQMSRTNFEITHITSITILNEVGILFGIGTKVSLTIV